MPPHGNLTNMGLTEPETERDGGLEKSDRERERERLPGEDVTFLDSRAQPAAWPLKLSIWLSDLI